VLAACGDGEVPTDTTEAEETPDTEAETTATESDFSTIAVTRVEGGNPPDIILFPHPA